MRDREEVLAHLSDHDLLASMREDAKTENRAAASKQLKMAEFRRRREQDYAERKAEDPHFALTPVQATVLEASPLLGVEADKVQADLRRTNALRTSFPGIWSLCESGQLDIYKAAMVSESAELSLKHAEDIPRLAEIMTRWLTPEATDDDPLPLVKKTRTQLRRSLSRQIAKFDKLSADERFKRGLKDRRVYLNDSENGMGYLSLNHAHPDLLAADYRLTLVAKKLGEQDPEGRTLQQLRADAMLGLLLGTVSVGAGTGELEDDETNDGRDPGDTVRRSPLAAFARPVINVTVPIQTLMGLSDEPGVMSGGSTIPASLARRLAQNPDSTWHRMLTDEARQCVELSTESYRPTAPIWRQVVADYQTCFVPTCATPATCCELDHRVPAPRGPTSTDNLGPGCRRDHKGKHARGSHLGRDPDGTLTFRTPSGFRHKVEREEQPLAEWFDGSLLETEPTAEEFLEALSFIRFERQQFADLAFQRWQEQKEWANYRASYPDAPDEDIASWVNGDDPRYEPPPILREGYTAMENELFARAAYGDLAFA